MRELAGLLLLVPTLSLCLAGQSASSNWPQLQCDPGHTGYTIDQPNPPYRLKWRRELGEPMHTGNQPIIARGKLFIGTNYGNLYALDRETGETIWIYQTDAPILGSPAFKDGIVYVNSMDHYCHAVNSSDGSGIWKYETGEGIWAAPVVADNKVFVAGRDGCVYALTPDEGKLVWKTGIGGLALTTPAYAEGTLYVGAGDMHIYAFRGETGELVWRSPEIPGAAMRDYWLVAQEGSVIATTQLVYACHPTQAMIQDAVMKPFIARHADDPVLVEDEVFPELVKWYEKHPHHKTFFVLDSRTGSEKFAAPVIGINGGSCSTPPPAIAPDGWAYTMYANIQLKASGWAMFGRLNLKTGEMEPLLKDRYAPRKADVPYEEWKPKRGHQFTRRSVFDGGFRVSDQSWGISIGGDIAFPVRDPGWKRDWTDNNMFHLKTGQDSYLIPDMTERRRTISGGQFGGAFHATASPVAISGREIFHKSARSVIFAFEGR